MYTFSAKIVLLIGLQNVVFGTVINDTTKISTEIPEEKRKIIKEIAVKISKSLNPTVDPCDDYFEYVCSNFDKNNMTINRFIDDIDFKTIIEKYLEISENKLDAEEKMLDFFNSCEQRPERPDIQQLIKSLNFPQSMKKLPAFDRNWNESILDLEYVVGELKAMDMDVLIDFECKEENGKKYMFISPKFLSKNLLETPDEKDERLRLKSAVLYDFGIENISEIMKDYDEFEEIYSNIFLSMHNETLQVRGNYLLVKSMIPDFNWDRYFQLVLGKPLSNNYPFRMRYAEVLRKLITTVRNIPPRILANYFFYRFLEKINEDITCGLFCSCYEKTLVFFQPVISRIVKNNFFTDELRKHFLNIITDFVHIQQYSLDVFDSKATEEVMDDIESIWNKDYFESLLDENVNREFAKFNISPENYYENVFQLYRNSIKRQNENFFLDIHKEPQVLDELYIQYILTNAIFHSHNKPLSIIFDMIGMPIVVKTIDSIKDQQRYSDFSQDCFRQQLNVSTALENRYLISIEGTELYVKTFNRWANKNWDLFEKEEEIFREYGLTSKKILYIIYIQTVCPYEQNDPHTRQSLLANLWNLRDFADAYNCPNGSRMNPEMKCPF